MSYVKVENLLKEYNSGDGTEVAVNDLSFSVEEGDIFTILGPSGCGKTTTLRCLAGLETINAGRIHLAGETVSDPSRAIEKEPEQRDIGLMYQSYALWPHMTVEENITYALDGRDYQGDNGQRVDEVLELVGMPEVRNRYPSELSGGQQQRVAFARALSYEPSFLLMDEPLSNLDLNQRREMRTNLLRILDEVGITTIYVTHDQEEAFEISDNTLVMNDGEKAQVGAPEELYKRPASSFVADFLGEANVLDVDVEPGEPTTCVMRTGDTQLRIQSNHDGPAGWHKPTATIRSEDIEILDGARADGNGGSNVYAATLEQRRFRGNVTLYLADVGGTQLKVQTEKPRYGVGQTVDLHIPPESVSIVDQ